LTGFDWLFLGIAICLTLFIWLKVRIDIRQLERLRRQHFINIVAFRVRLRRLMRQVGDI